MSNDKQVGIRLPLEVAAFLEERVSTINEELNQLKHEKKLNPIFKSRITLGQLCKDIILDYYEKENKKGMKV